MRRRTLALALTLLAVPLAGCTSDEAPADEAGPRSLTDAVRQASGWIDTPREARAAGYEPAAFCVPGEGVHWIDEALVDTRIDPFTPEVVLFQPTRSDVTDPDHQRFVGVEYVAVTEGTAHNRSGNPPTVQGVPMDGPYPGRGPDGRWHAVLHVYVADGIPSDPSFSAQHDAIDCPAGTEAPGTEPAPAPGDSRPSDANAYDDCGTLTGRTVHDHAKLLVHLDGDEPFDFSPERYQLATRTLYIEGGERDANGTIVHVHEARPTLDCLFDTLGWEVSNRSILTDTGEVYAENETHRIVVTRDGDRLVDGFRTQLEHGRRYVVSFEDARGPRPV